MYEHRVPVSPSPQVEITSCQGDLTVMAVEGSEVLIRVARQEILTVEQRDDATALVINGDGQLTLPRDAALTVVQVQGDLSITGAGGPVEAITVRGDLYVQEMNGPLSVQSVVGDAHVRQVQGLVAVKNIGADLMARDLLGGADVTLVGGDVSLKTVFAGSHPYHIAARGNLTVKVYPNSDATFDLRSRRTLVKGIEGQQTKEGEWQGAVGNGQSAVTLVTTHGSIVLKAADEQDEQPITAAAWIEPTVGKIGVEAGLAADELAWRIQQRVAEKLSKIDFEAIALREAERARMQAEREAARAQKTIEKARRKAERARSKAHQQWRVEWESGSQAARRGQAVSDQERLAVLKMLAEGKISAQEAETLLQALEG
ncbi:MAG: SHOCT-like domain-containing protein [Chloroflexota bacterium]